VTKNKFIVRGATQFREPGVFMMFEENAKELTANVRSLGFDLDQLVAKKKIVLDHVIVERSEIEETASTTSMGFSSGWGTLLTPAGPSVWCSTQWRRCSLG
jgi:KaiC/GvpD/RAD55 family RecA-like ATPase